MAESRHVFLAGIEAPEIWQGLDHFTIGELGFGTGLNFLATWQLWQQTCGPGARLNFISIEKHPLTREQLQRALLPFPELSDQANALVKRYPEAHPGYHRLELDQGRVSLTLIIGDVASSLEQMGAVIDGWYLDGFSPSKNPEMWSSDVFTGIALRSKRGTRVATFSVAGNVRRGLEEAGFRVNKRPALPPKTDCLKGVFEARSVGWKLKPWLALPSQPQRAGTACVIGGGIAGCSVAATLSEAGIETVLIDRHSGPAEESSGNPAGIIMPTLTVDDSLHGRFQSTSYLHALNRLNQLARSGAPVWFGQRGVLALPDSLKESKRQQRLIDNKALPPSHLQQVEQAVASEVAGIELPSGGLFYRQAGCINPAAVCHALIKGLPSRFGLSVTSVERSPQGWRVRLADGEILETDIVVFANALEASQLSPGGPLPLTPMRGQVTRLEATPASQNLKVPLVYGGYITPAVQTSSLPAFHITGATFTPWDNLDNDSWKQSRPQDNQQNLETLKSQLPDLHATLRDRSQSGRAGLRAMTGDHLPLIGGMIDNQVWVDNYTGLHHGPRHKKFPPAPYLEGLYVSTGFGSHGFQGAFLAASLLTDLIAGSPLPLPVDVLSALNPGRFIIKQLKLKT